MDTHIPSFLILASIFFSTFIFFILFKSKTSTPNLPPGPWKLHLIGNIHNLIGSVPHRALHQLALKYGPLMHLQLGELSVIVVSSPDAAKQVMKTHDLNFASRPSLLAAEIVGYNCSNITFGPYGDYWRQLRKICTLELLSVKRVQSFRSLRKEVFLDLVKWIGTMEEGKAFNLSDKLNAATYAIVARAALGEISKERQIMVPIIKEVLVRAGGFDITDVYPSVKLFRMMSTVRRKLSALHHEADKILDEIINEHKLANSSVKSSDDEKQDDLLDVLLKYQDKGLELPLTNNNIKSVIVDILGGGSETSATTMDWAMAEMLKNPSIMEKAQHEVRRVFDDKGFVDESGIHELHYLKSVVKETLRLHPPLPLLLPRKCGETCEINGYHIPANTKIIINAYAINRDSNNWKDADCFQPERFVDSQVDFKGNHFEFIPFVAGRRICPGMSFGLANVELPLAMLLYHFDWKLGGGEELDMKEGFGVTAPRVNHLCVVPFLRRPLPMQIE